MKLVKQKNSKGCGIAAIAMITGKTYDEVKKDLYGTMGQVEGMYPDRDIVPYVVKEGFESHRIEVWKEGCEVPGCRIPQYPITLVQMRVYVDSPGLHFVVMTEDGKLYDPIFGETTWDDYHSGPFDMYGFKKA